MTNKRYLNIIIHSIKKFWNLGLVRIQESFTAEFCVQRVKERLNDFGIDLDYDIVAVVTDGPSVMKKIGTLLKADHSLCYAHAVHLAVCNLLYKPKSQAEDDFHFDCLESDEDENFENDDTALRIESNVVIMNLSNEFEIDKVIKNVRKIILMFKRSPLKNDTILEKYVKAEHGKELSVLLDCKTLWNSFLTMLERVMLLKSSIKKALVDLNCELQLFESDFKVIAEIIELLNPVKLTVSAICWAVANLCTDDAAFKFLLKELYSKNTLLATKMAKNIVDRLKERHRDELSGVVCYQQNGFTGNDLFPEIDNVFYIPKKNL